MRPNRIGLVINRATPEREEPLRRIAREVNLEVLGSIPEDENITSYDLIGKPITEIPPSSPALIAVHQILKRLGLAC